MSDNAYKSGRSPRFDGPVARILRRGRRRGRLESWPNRNASFCFLYLRTKTAYLRTPVDGDRCVRSGSSTACAIPASRPSVRTAPDSMPARADSCREERGLRDQGEGERDGE